MKFFYIFVLGILWNASYSFGDSACQRDGTLNQAHRSSQNALDEFKKHDKFLRYDEFDEFLQHLDEYRNERGLSFDLADYLKDLIKDAMNVYLVSAQSAYQWCGIAVNCFQWYIQQLQNTTKDAAMKQHHIVLQLLDEELQKLHSAQDKFQAAISSLDEVSNDSIVPQLDAAYEKYSTTSKQQIQDLQIKVKESRNGVLSIVRDTDETRKLKSEIDQLLKDLVRLEKLNNVLKKHIDVVDITAYEMKVAYDEEFNELIHVKSQAQMAYDIIYIAIQEDNFSLRINNLIEHFVEKLIDQCGIYRARHN